MTEQACSLCHTSTDDQPLRACHECAALYHADCFEEVGGCGTYGCSRVPSVSAQANAAVPPTLWGRETKDCTRCGKEIRAAALRCRFCGTRFTRDDPLAQADDAPDGPRIRRETQRQAWFIFILGFVPFMAPLVLPVGGIFSSPV